MTAVYVILAIIAFFAVVLSLSVSFHIFYDGDFKVILFYGPIRFTLYPVKQKEEQKQKEKNAVAKATEQKSKTEQKEDKDFFKTVSTVIDTVKAILGPAVGILKKIRIKKLDATVIVASDDAAQTAENYGKTSAVVYGAVVAAKNLINISVKNLFVGYDFNNTKTTYKVSFKVKLRLIHAVIGGLGILKNILVNTLKTDKLQATQSKSNA